MEYDLAVLSVADAAAFDLLSGLVRSLREKPEAGDCALYVVDLGLTGSQRQWLLIQGAKLRWPDLASDPPGAPGAQSPFFSRCRIPELFPVHDVYLWIDANAWVQCWDAVEQYVEGALRTGFAITPVADPAYDRDDIPDPGPARSAVFGAEPERLSSTLPVDDGVFAGRADAPHWAAWRRLIETATVGENSDPLPVPLDLMALGIICSREDLPTTLLPSTCDWISHLALPMVDAAGVMTRPCAPYEKLGIVHQTEDTARRFLPLLHQGGGSRSRALGCQSRSRLAADEYVSPGLQLAFPDQCFPNMVRGNQAASTWPYLRRGLPHAWLVDRRLPTWGFLNRDEVHILYNLALACRGERALEIGCLMGWSACHIAMAGLDLDIIDPLLSNPDVQASVRQSISACGPGGKVALVVGSSPHAVHELAKARPGGWSLFFIDGDHDGEAPVNDVEACLPYAAPDCAMVFHDLASPDVTNAVVRLKTLGWNTRVYHTAQIMAVAWRGDFRPIAHQPDPRIAWEIPDHVMPLLL
jgi:predicted O-methyltransferase YrrM